MKELFIDDFISYLNGFGQKSQSEMNQFLDIVTFHEILPGHRLIRAGQVCDKMYFVGKGFLKYVLEKKNTPTVIHIAAQGDLITDFFSFYSSMPAISDVFSITPCSLFSVEKTKLEKLYESSKVWEHFGRKVAEDAIVQHIMERIKIQIQSPEERYLDIIESKSELLKNVKLGDLAQTLGISQETLSRIRKRIK